MTTPADGLPLISVVVPSYNQGHFLPDTFESIFRQGYPRLEVVVIDGGSTDASVDIIRKHDARLKFWRSERDGGQSAAINEGMRHCSGDLVAWLNSDDFYWDDCLWTVGKAFARHPGHGLYVGNGLRYDQKAGTHTPFNTRHVAMDREALSHGADFILQPSTFFLRQAWQRVGGLDEQLRFCMDWDIFIRIAALYPCVLVNEFLGVSREYEETKTRSGKMERVFEIVRMIRRHTGQELTPGGLLYLLETVAGLGEAEGVTERVSHRLRLAFLEIVDGWCARHGRGNWFPAHTDPQDTVYLPLAGAIRVGPDASGVKLPTISLVVSDTGDADALRRTLASVRNQAYPAAETVVAGPGETGLDDAIARSAGELLVLAKAGDLFADGAVRAAGRVFASEPEVDVLCGNALHLDESDELFLAYHGPFDSGFWIGELPPQRVSAGFQFDPFRAPRPAVYFRRDVLERSGASAPGDAGPTDAAFFRRLAAPGKTRKLERTMALCRVSRATYREDRQRQIDEWYREERSHWPRPWQRGFRGVLRRFVGNYMRWKFSGEPSRLRYWWTACLAAASAASGVGNPMGWWPDRDVPLAPPFKRGDGDGATRSAAA
jgi:hypothetical protein